MSLGLTINSVCKELTWDDNVYEKHTMRVMSDEVI